MCRKPQQPISRKMLKPRSWQTSRSSQSLLILCSLITLSKKPLPMLIPTTLSPKSDPRSTHDQRLQQQPVLITLRPLMHKLVDLQQEEPRLPLIHINSKLRLRQAPHWQSLPTMNGDRHTARNENQTLINTLTRGTPGRSRQLRGSGCSRNLPDGEPSVNQDLHDPEAEHLRSWSRIMQIVQSVERAA